jgi:hypothetical protein
LLRAIREREKEREGLAVASRSRWLVPADILVELLLQFDERIVGGRREADVAEDRAHDERADLLRLRSWSPPCVMVEERRKSSHFGLDDHLYGRGRSYALVLDLALAVCDERPQRRREALQA